MSAYKGDRKPITVRVPVELVPELELVVRSWEASTGRTLSDSQAVADLLAHALGRPDLAADITQAEVVSPLSSAA